MAPALAPIRDLLTSFSPSSDFLALSSGDGRIKVWDAVRGHLQTEFADIPAVEVGAISETKRGHLALDYTCMKWVQLLSKKRKAGSSLLVLGTGSGDVLALDVAAGQWKWRISDCHPGGVTAVAYSRQGRSVYTAGADGMVCKIDPSDGFVAGKFKSSSKAISALAVSSDGTILATAAGQLRTFDASDNKKIQKFSGHPVAVRSMIFSDNGEYVLSSGVGERYVAIWRLGSGKTQSSSCILSMEHPAIFVDCKCSGFNASEGEIHVLAISETGICYFWSGNIMDDLRNKKPTKIALSESSLSRTRQDFAIFAAKLQGIDGPNSAHVLLAYGSVVKPLFDKLLVCYGKDINLGVSEDGVLVPTIQPTMPQKGQSTKTKGTITVLDRANAKDAILPLPKLHTQEKKRKHGVTKPSGDKLAIDSDLGTTARLTERRDAKPWYHDMICVLFETPSGFAIFYCCASLIEGPDVLEVLWDNFTKNSDAHCVVWLKQFKTFKDKSSAIQQNSGVNEMLRQMIEKWCSPWMKLAVGKPEYKQIIEECLKIPCIHCPAVMELMWGIQNCMRSLVPREKRKLTEADRLPISHGLHKVLSRYDCCVVKPEMVSELIVQTASALFWCDSVEKEKRTPLRNVRCLIKSVSGINCDDWTLLKVAAAAKAIWWPEEIGNSCVEFSKEEVSMLVRDRDKYELLIDKYGWLGTYNDMISVHDVRTTKKELLKFLVKKAKASEAKQVAETVAAVN